MDVVTLLALPFPDPRAVMTIVGILAAGLGLFALMVLCDRDGAPDPAERAPTLDRDD